MAGPGNLEESFSVGYDYRKQPAEEERDHPSMPGPSYIALYNQGRLKERIDKANRLLEECTLCPRRCRVDRSAGQLGICKTGTLAVVSSYHAHFGEESPLVGRHGSGTIFFTHCNLRCIFCQNYEISHLGEGEPVSAETLARIMLELQRIGCHNINFVTPTHVVPQILAALAIAVEGGLRIPLVYNTGGYDSVETLRLLEGIVDIYMPDFKFTDPKVASLCCNAADYGQVARAAIREMHRQVGDLVVNQEGIAERGLLVRHLVMPGGLSGTREVVEFLSEEISKNTYLNIMNQYRPCGQAHKHPPMDRMISAGEYSEALEAAKAAGLKRLDKRERLRILRFF